MSPRLEARPEMERAGVVAAGVAGLVALLAAAGWIVNAPVLSRLLPAYPAATFNAAVGLLGAAVGLFGVARGRQRWIPGLIGAAVAAIIGAITLSEYLDKASFGFDTALFRGHPMLDLRTPFPGRMPAATALSLLLAGGALLAQLEPRWRRAGAVAAGIVGAIIAALATTVLLSMSTGVLSSLRDDSIIGLALPSCLALAALGAGLMLTAWTRDPSIAMMPAWLPYGLGIGMLITTLLLWRALDATEQEHATGRLQTLAEVARRKVASDLDAVFRSLRRRGASVADGVFGTGPAGQDWVNATTRFVTDEPGVRAILWFDSTLAVHATVRRDAAAPAGVRLAEEEVRAALAEWKSEPNPRAILGRVTQDDGGRPLLGLVAPNCGGKGCSGFTASLLDTQAFFAEGLAGVTPGYRVTVSVGGHLLFGGAGPGSRPQPQIPAAPFDAAGLPWVVELWPDGPGPAGGRSDLPLVVAALGAAVSVLLTLTLRLVQTGYLAARASERARLARAMETATDGLWEWNHRTGETSRSAAVWRRLGYEANGSEQGKHAISWNALVHPDDRPALDARLQEHLAGTGDGFEVEYRVRARNGEWHWMVDRGRIMERDARGRPVYSLGLCADVTERRRSEQALAASEHRFRTMFDRGFQLEFLLDAAGNLLEANRTSLDFAGVTLESVRGKPFWATPWWSGDEARRDRLQQGCAESLRGEVVRFQEEAHGDADRSTTVDLSLTPIVDGEGAVVQILAEGRDISERQRLEDTMRELDSLSTMGRLAARVAHEINNPLAGIQNSFLLIKGAIPPNHPYFGYVGAIEREIARMAAITRQLYETYRPDGDTREDASIPVLISDAVTMLEQVNRPAQIRIEVDTSGSPPVLSLPGALLRQAVYNLVQNAVEASPAGGVVRVTAWRADSTFWLSVADQGPGVPVQIRERIFEPFVTTKGGLQTGGMGLGLSLVRRSVQALGGRIELHDPDSGGAEFRIAIPLR